MALAFRPVRTYIGGKRFRDLPWKKCCLFMDPKMILLIVIGLVLLIALIALFGGGMVISGMAMMAGAMSTPLGWVALLIILALAGFLGWAALYMH